MLDVFDLFARVEIWLSRPLYQRVSVCIFHGASRGKKKYTDLRLFFRDLQLEE